MLIEIIEGHAGCQAGIEKHAVVVVVDALRASATAAALLAAGATDLWLTQEVEQAFRAREIWPDALLFGERGGLPPEGFDYGNSPTEAGAAAGRRVIFTTTTGAGRMVAAWGAREAMMGTTVNASAVVAYLCSTAPERVVIVPAGLMSEPDFDALEDWTASVHIAHQLCLHGKGEVAWGRGYERYRQLLPRIENEGLASLFHAAPHARKLWAIHKESDISFCARQDLYDVVPTVYARNDLGALVRDGGQDKRQRQQRFVN